MNDMQRIDRAWITRTRAAALPVVLLLGALYFASVVGAHYPIGRWLFFRYAGAWLASAAFAAACLSSGHAILRRALGHTLPLAEHAAIAFAVGVYVFFLSMMLAGLAGLLGPALFVGLPLALIAAGAPSLLRSTRRLARHLRYRRARAARPSPFALPILAFGMLGVGMVYFAILTPDNVAFDARWQHLAVAEHYAAAGAVGRFPEGWIIGASPQLASILYTWAFLLPKGALFDRVELAAHLEFTTFLFTLVGVTALTRRLVPAAFASSPPARGEARAAADAGHAPRPARARLGLAWVARFLFPGVFLYDSSLCVGADHVVALFAVPLYALLLRAYGSLSTRLCVLLSLMMAGAFLTKHTGAITLLGFPVIAIALRAVWILARAAWARSRGLPSPSPAGAGFRGPLAAVAGFLAFTAPHWAKNWAFYGDPLYPLLRDRLTLRPWTADASERFEWGFLKAELWRPTMDMAGLRASLKALFTFSFIPNDWPRFHGTVPVIGSLFTLLLFCLPFLPRSKRLYGLFAAVHLGVFAWYWMHHQDRYLQTLMPWMAACVAAVIAIAWQTNLATRVALTGLIALQIVWGGDVYFIPGHVMVSSPVSAVSELLSSGYRKDWKRREAFFMPYASVAPLLPPGAKVLVHERHPHLGLGSMSVNDFPTNQGGISYGLLGSPRAAYDLLQGFGVTHLLWSAGESYATDTLAGDLVFFALAAGRGRSARIVEGLTLAEMPATPPPAGGPDDVFVLTCPGGLTPGLYRLADLRTPVYGPRKGHSPPPRAPATTGGAGAEALVAEATYAITEPKCPHDADAAIGKAFQRLAARKGGYVLWARPSPP
jgi:hypothetical protein